MLHVQRHGQRSERPSLVAVHGLLGSGRNLGIVARDLAREREVVVVDLRNHGESFHHPSHTYPELAADLARVIEVEGAPMDVMGHSMGGKAAMALALSHPALVRRLAVLDIAPVAYGHTQQPSIDAMRRVDLATVGSRKEAEAQMQAPEGLAPFLLQNLDLPGRRWRANLDALERHMGDAVGWPEIEGRFEGPALFLAGELSDYVRPKDREAIRALFPKARVARIKGAGHWLHADRPREVAEAVRAFLDAEVSAG